LVGGEVFEEFVEFLVLEGGVGGPGCGLHDVSSDGFSFAFVILLLGGWEEEEHGERAVWMLWVVL
jgi:hypothetical protein